MKRMERIDSKLDATLGELERNQDSTPLQIALKVATLFPIPVPVLPALDALSEHFTQRNRIRQIVEVLRVFSSELQALEQECGEDAARIQAIYAFLKSDRFTDAVIVAAEETARTANSEKIRRFGLVLANGCDPNIEVSHDEDVSSFIRDVSQLSELDIQTLQIVVSTARLGILLQTDVPDTTDSMLGQHLVTAALQEKIEQDDFYSHAYRLVGFGLLLEAPSGSGRRDAKNLRFVPTRRGRKFLALLQQRV